MKFSHFVLGMEVVQWGALGYGYLFDAPTVVSTIALYGSPLHMVFHALTLQPVLYDNNPYIIGMLIWHVVKYFCFFKTQLDDDRTVKMVLAGGMEMAYLALSGFKLY